MSSRSVSIITAVPASVSPAEHRNIVASTPPSFSDIPPVLRHREENVSVTLDPPLAELTPEDTASGVLYIIESALVFMSSTGRGFQVAYPAITLHAISRAEGRPSIYCQLDEASGISPLDGPPRDASDDVTEMRELIIVPQESSSLEPIFEAMSVCASLHPDPNLSEEDETDDVIVASDSFETLSGDEGEELSEVGRAALAHLESIIDDSFHPDADANGNLNGVDRGQVVSEHDEAKE